MTMDESRTKTSDGSVADNAVRPAGAGPKMPDFSQLVAKMQSDRMTAALEELFGPSIPGAPKKT